MAYRLGKGVHFPVRHLKKPDFASSISETSSQQTFLQRRVEQTSPANVTDARSRIWRTSWRVDCLAIAASSFRSCRVAPDQPWRWVLNFGPLIARRLRQRRPQPSKRWHLDEMVVRIASRRIYLWRAVDDEGEILDMLVQRPRDTRAALRLMRKLLKKLWRIPALCGWRWSWGPRETSRRMLQGARPGKPSTNEIAPAPAGWNGGREDCDAISQGGKLVMVSSRDRDRPLRVR